MATHRRAWRLALAALSLAAATAAAAEGAAPLLSVHDGAGPARQLTLADLQALPTVLQDATLPREGSAQYRCARLADVLAQAGVPMGASVRGKRLAEVVRVGARDGYQVAFALVELDVQFREPVALLCFERDGHAIGGEEGPLRLIVPGEKMHGRWVRQVERLTWVR